MIYAYVFNVSGDDRVKNNIKKIVYIITQVTLLICSNNVRKSLKLGKKETERIKIIKPTNKIINTSLIICCCDCVGLDTLERFALNKIKLKITIKNTIKINYCNAIVY